jgi:hypothetical protein
MDQTLPIAAITWPNEAVSPDRLDELLYIPAIAFSVKSGHAEYRQTGRRTCEDTSDRLFASVLRNGVRTTRRAWHLLIDGRWPVLPVHRD